MWPFQQIFTVLVNVLGWISLSFSPAYGKFNPKSFMQNYTKNRTTFIRNFKSRINSLPLNHHKPQLYLLEQYSESFGIWSAIIRINREGKSLIMKSSPDLVFSISKHVWLFDSAVSAPVSTFLSFSGATVPWLCYKYFFALTSPVLDVGLMMNNSHTISFLWRIR